MFILDPISVARERETLSSQPGLHAHPCSEIGGTLNHLYHLREELLQMKQKNWNKGIGEQ